MNALADPFRLDGFVIDGKYRVATVVGDGGFGVVYRGVHKGFGELIAVKCLKIPGELEPAEREALLEQLREEGRILHRLSKVTSGIVQALDVGAFEAPSGAWVPYLVLEWLEGEPLSVVMRRRERGDEGGLSAEAALDLLEPAARALAVAHQQKVAHRDVKPANLFVTEVGGRKTIKVLDFGIAKVLSEHHSKTGMFEATAMGPTAFTPRYGAPEQFNKKRGASGPWTDVFALALIFVELLTAKRALEGDDPTQLYVASADLSSRPTARARGTETSDAIEAVLVKALAVDPRDRWEDVGAFWDALETAVRGAPPVRASRGSRPDAPAKPAREGSGAGDADLGPTVPAESLRRTPGANTRRSPDEDPMAETPAGARPPPSAARSAPPAAAAGPASERPGGFPWALVAAGIFVVGAGFAWWTWTDSAQREVVPVASASASAKAPGPKQKPPRAKPTASASAVTSASAAPTASASAAPAVTYVTRDGMVKIAPQVFAMGEGAVQTSIPRAFWIDQHEATLRQYQTCDDGCGSVEEPSPELADWGAQCNAARSEVDGPVNCVDWASARAYCAAKGKRLPTEAEWELTARGVGGRRYPWGSAEPACESVCAGRVAECSAQGKSTCVPGGSPVDVTPEGIFDLGGNVSEWVEDAVGDRRVVRGGSFAGPFAWSQGTWRIEQAATLRHAAIGFRCALDAGADAPP